MLLVYIDSYEGTGKRFSVCLLGLGILIFCLVQIFVYWTQCQAEIDNLLIIAQPGISAIELSIASTVTAMMAAAMAVVGLFGIAQRWISKARH